MPKSRRDRPVSLTKVKPKGRQVKDRLVASIRDCLSNFSHVYVFETINQQNRRMKEIRDEWAGSRFFLGKNRVMQSALGRDDSSELVPGASAIGQFLAGPRGLLFTEKPRDEVMQYFDSFSDIHYARSGCVAEETFTLEEGPLPIEYCPHPIEPQLRKLGLPTKLHGGVIQLLKDVVVCSQGDILTPEQCNILKIFHKPMATFKIAVVAHLHDGQVESLGDGFKSNTHSMDDDEQAELSDEEFVPALPKQWGEIALPTIESINQPKKGKK